MLRFFAGFLAGVAIVAGVLTGKMAFASPERQTLWSDFCIYRVEDVSYWLDLPYGSAKMITGVAGNWDGWISDYQAVNAVGAFGCQRVY
ncbi:MAG TPA: hypothetical protein VNM43_04960 [Dehalococcoidia bacterium]|nr:hypothetical protein [Dehalococcoidia bacterium]